MANVIDVLRCPITGSGLQQASGSLLVSAEGRQYAVRNGVHCLLPDAPGKAFDTSVQDFYEAGGWQPDDHGDFGDTRLFVDQRPAPLRFTQDCMRRLARHFSRGGEYFLDAGSGPIPHDALLAYSQRFARRICVDLSVQALEGARTRAGAHGAYLQGDLAHLPLADNSMDAACCYHVIYQLPFELQAQALRELWRVLKPGGVAVVVGWWASAPLEWRAERVARILGMRGPGQPDAPDVDVLPHNVRERRWFEAQDWPFRYDYDVYRVVTNRFMRDCIPDDWRGEAFLGGLAALQRIAPGFCGRHGVMPALLIRKD